MASHYNVQFASANYNAPYHYPAPRPDHKLELQLQTSMWEWEMNTMAAHRQTGERQPPVALRWDILIKHPHEPFTCPNPTEHFGKDHLLVLFWHFHLSYFTMQLILNFSIFLNVFQLCASFFDAVVFYWSRVIPSLSIAKVLSFESQFRMCSCLPVWHSFFLLQLDYTLGGT